MQVLEHEKPNCPECKSNSKVRKDGFSKLRKQQYYCVTCDRQFILNPHKSGRKLIDVSANPRCPLCNNLTIRAGLTENKTKQRFKCRTCKHTFVQNPEKSPKIKKKLEDIGKNKRIRKDKTTYPECPLCHTKTHVGKRGKTQAGTQRYVCTACKKTFMSEHAVGSFGFKFQKGHAKTERKDSLSALPFFDCVSLLKNFNKQPQTFDSLNEVPCLGCSSLEHGCTPETCVNMDKWLKV